MTRQRDPKTGRFVDPDPTDRPTRPTKAQAQNIYAELDTANERIVALEGRLEDAAKLAAVRWDEIRARNTEIQKLKAQAETARRDADGLQALLANEEEARRAWEATANQRQEVIERQTNRIATLQISEVSLTEALEKEQFEVARLTQIASNDESHKRGLREELQEVQQSRDALQVERDQARAEVRRLRDEARGSLLASLFLLAIGGGGGALVAWIVRGWLHD